MELKINDVYKFRYNEEYLEKLFEPYHCFDAQLIVKQGIHNLYLEDTYWSTGNNKTFTLEQALEKGTLEFVCNLDEVEEIRSYDMRYYDDNDLFNLSRQHNCYGEYYKRKSAKKSAKKMEQVLIDEIKEIEHAIKSKEWDLKRANEKLEKLRLGDMDIYL